MDLIKVVLMICTITFGSKFIKELISREWDRAIMFLICAVVPIVLFVIFYCH